MNKLVTAQRPPVYCFFFGFACLFLLTSFGAAKTFFKADSKRSYSVPDALCSVMVYMGQAFIANGINFACLSLIVCTDHFLKLPICLVST
jgi:hypothetical protein